MLYTKENIGELLSTVNGSFLDIGYQDRINEFRYKRYELQVHSQGLVYDKVFSLFPSETYDNQLFVLNSYEPITKGDFWQGVDNLKNIFGKTSVSITGDADIQLKFSDEKYLKSIFDYFLNIGAVKDPNAILIWQPSDEGWKLKVVYSEDILRIDDDAVSFIDREKSAYMEKDDISNIEYSNKDKERHRKTELKIIRGKKYNYTNTVIGYASKEQYIEIFNLEKNNKKVEITNYKRPLNNTPYVYLGVDKDNNSYNSPLHPFIPFADQALIQYRLFNIVHNLFGYPRIQELETECNVCRGKGEMLCRTTQKYKECDSCDGTGKKSLQSVWNAYTLKQDDENPENNNIDVVKFHTMPTDILVYNRDTYKHTLKDAAKAIYIQSRIETGNVESAESKQETMKSMFAWLSRIGGQYYGKTQQMADNRSDIEDWTYLHFEEPNSYQILDELQAFEILDKTIKSDAPSFLKVNQIEQFLGKYISQSNPLNRFIRIIKKYDEFAFFSKSELESYSDRALVSDEDIKKHIRAYSVLQKLIANDEKILLKTDEEIISDIDLIINPPMNIEEKLENSESKLTQTVGGLQGIIEVAKSISEGTYDLEAGIAMVSSLYKVDKAVAAQWLGTPNSIPTPPTQTFE